MADGGYNYGALGSGAFIFVLVLIVLICCVMPKCRKESLKRKGYDFVKTSDSEFFSTDADIEEMSEINIDDDIEEI